MGIRIQPKEIEVPQDDPFKYDLLERKEAVEVLTHLVGSLEGPCVLAVDAAWGAGKTTFLRIWQQYLRNQGFPVIEFNAWENDFSGDPLVALSTELTEGLNECRNGPLNKKIDETKRAAKEVLKRAVPGVIRLATAGMLDVNPLLEKELGQTLASYAEGRLTEYKDTKVAIDSFRAALKDMAVTLSQSSENRPLIVMIDELDRCRPSYAVELLEIAKHLFAVDRIVFVLAVNRSQLAHSIRAVYGSDFDAEGYLRRFFDADFRLPASDRDRFIDAQLDGIRVNDYFKRTADRTVISDNEEESVRNLLKVFFGAHDLSLRQIAQAIHRLGLVYASLQSNLRSFAITAAVLLIVQTIDPNLYQKFRHRQVSDADVVDKVVNGAVDRTLAQQFESRLFEAMIVVAFREEEIANMSAEEPFKSPLLQRYKELLAARQGDWTSRDPDRERAEQVMTRVQQYRRYDGILRFGFLPSAARLELLSSDLIGEHSDEAPKQT
ncbi:MAG: P-loop NTPase fold protein [Bryobacterales bacterium]|nr:P-loop NTPase fold protein [Bryobacterales bacterium]